MKELKDIAEFDALLKSGRLLVVDFKAEWCGPCRMIAPKLETLAMEYEGSPVDFVKVDVDKLSNVARRVGISAMPTFQFYKNGEVVEEIVGADFPKVKATLVKLLATSHRSPPKADDDRDEPIPVRLPKPQFERTEPALN